METDPNFTVVIDKLYEHPDNHDVPSTGNSTLLRLEHGCLSVDVQKCGPMFRISLCENNERDTLLAQLECSVQELEENVNEICDMALEYELSLAGNDGMRAEYAEFFRTVRDNRLNLEFIDGKAKSEILELVGRRFVEGNPRALWLNLKQPPVRLGNPGKDPYWRLPEYIDGDRRLYMIIDIDNLHYAVYKGLFKDIHTFIGDCERLDEYYLLSEACDELWCATDHDELLYIKSDY